MIRYVRRWLTNLSQSRRNAEQPDQGHDGLQLAGYDRYEHLSHRVIVLVAIPTANQAGTEVDYIKLLEHGSSTGFNPLYLACENRPKQISLKSIPENPGDIKSIATRCHGMHQDMIMPTICNAVELCIRLGEFELCKAVLCIMWSCFQLADQSSS